MGKAALSDTNRNEEWPAHSQSNILSQGESNRLWASLYKIRFDECGAVRGKISPAIQHGPEGEIDIYSCCFIIARENGRILLDIHGKPALFTSRSEAERWLMPDERVEPFRPLGHRSPIRTRGT